MPVRAGLAMDAAARAAIAASHLRDLRPDVLDRLLDGARRLDVAAGVTIHREGEHVRHVELVVRGLVRVHVSAPDGRTLTVRYCRIGALMGILSLYSEPFVMPATTQAVLDAEILVMNPAVVRRLAERDVRPAVAKMCPAGRDWRGSCQSGWRNTTPRTTAPRPSWQTAECWSWAVLSRATRSPKSCWQPG